MKNAEMVVDEYAYSVEYLEWMLEYAKSLEGRERWADEIQKRLKKAKKEKKLKEE